MACNVFSRPQGGVLGDRETQLDRRRKTLLAAGRRMGKVVDVARVRVHEALLLRRDLVRSEVVRWHRESIVEVGWGRRTRAGAA